MRAFPVGTEVYAVDSPPVRARGIRFTVDDLPPAVIEVVRDVMRDAAGEEAAVGYLESLEETGFDRQVVEAVLFDEDVLAAAEQWRVGEAVAQAELEANRDCSFPWSARRDAKNRRASAAGAEMVGFVRPSGPAARFAFGEVKTSSENSFPPSVVRDLRRQIEELRDDQKVVKALIEYLTFRAPGAAWEEDFVVAFTAWLADPLTFAVYGVLVRDVEGRQADLRALAASLGPNTASPTEVELRALYFPPGRIPGTKLDPPEAQAA